MGEFGSYGKFTTHPGQRDSLVALLLEAASSMQSVPGCELYLVNTSPTESETVWVTEVWSSEQAHDASLTLESARALIQRAMPLIAGIESIKLRPTGGFVRERFEGGGS
jgi:quinol monooxygenase YgiN